MLPALGVDALAVGLAPAWLEARHSTDENSQWAAQQRASDTGTDS